MRRLCYVGVLAACVGLPQTIFAQGGPLPWGQSSDMVAWEAFVQITAPSGQPQAKKVEFETWASDDDVYAKSPAQWPAIDAPKLLQTSALGRAHLRGELRPFAFIPGACLPPGGLPAPNGDGAAAGSGFPTNVCIGEEVRRNWASFQYIVANGLDSQAGLARAAAAGFKVDLPADAVEFKGDWVSVADVATWLKVDPAVIRQHYYTSFSTISGAKTEIALLGFHVSTKQIKNWVWADFEGAINPGRCDVIGCHDGFGATVADVSANQTPYQSYGDCPKNATLTAMMQNAGSDPIWQNYCLKGSQITFVDGGGNPIRLGNSIIEPLNAGVPISVSSCMTCHAYASFGNGGSINPFALTNPLNSPTGNVDPTKMQGFVANDFIWGISVGNLKAQ